MDDLEEGHVVSLANEIFDSCERSSNEVLTRIELTLGVRNSGPDLRSRLASVLGLDAEAAGDARAFEGAFADLDTDSSDSVNRQELEDYLVQCWEIAKSRAAESAAETDASQRGGLVAAAAAAMNDTYDSAAAKYGAFEGEERNEAARASSSSPEKNSGGHRSPSSGKKKRQAMYEVDYGPNATPEQQRIMELEMIVKSRNEEIDALRRQLLTSQRTNELQAQSDVPINPDTENTIYGLDRRASLAEVRNKEHSNALALSAKKIIELERSVKAYKFTAKDVAKCLGDCLHGGVSVPVTKEQLEDTFKAVTAASPVSPDAVMALRLAEKLVEIMQVLDGELQQALSDVPGSVREALRNVPAFEERLMRHSKGNGQVTAELNSLLNNVEDATAQFDFEMDTLVPDPDGPEQQSDVLNSSGASGLFSGLTNGLNGYNGASRGGGRSSSMALLQHSQQFSNKYGRQSRDNNAVEKDNFRAGGSSNSVDGGAGLVNSAGRGSVKGDLSPPKFAGDPGYLSMENFFQVS